MGGIGAVHHMPFGVAFDGVLDVAALAWACEAVVARHPALRSAVVERDGEPWRVAADRPEMTVVDTTPEGLPAASREVIGRPFDLARGPLCRMVLFRLGPRAHRLLVVVHHIVFDGQSTDLFVADLAAAYREGLDRTEIPAEPTEPMDQAAAKEYWAAHWREPGPPVLPGLTAPAPTDTGTPGGAVEFAIDGDRRDLLDKTAARLGVSVFELILASVHTLLFRYGNERPVVAVDLGTRTAGNGRQIGVFVNELPVATVPDPGATCRSFVTGLRADLRELYRVRRVPLGRAVAGLAPGVTLVPISLSYRRRAPAPEFPGLATRVDWVLFNHTARGALRFHLVDGPDRIGVMLQYPERALGRPAAEAVAGHWLELLDAVLADPDTRLEDLPLVSARERAEILAAAEHTGTVPATTVPAMIAARCQDDPYRTAVVCGTRTLTYGELDRASDRLAARLRAGGVRPGDVVGVHLSRDAELPIGLLAVWKAGAAYLPLDPEHPPARLRLALADAAATVLLTDAPTDLAPDGTTLVMAKDADAGHPISPLSPVPTDRAYVIHTSGSTGRPKGVEVEHGALAGLLLAMRDLLGAGPADRWLGLTSLSFDIAALELLLPLVCGARLILADDARRADGTALGDLVRAHGVTHVQATPSGWLMLLDAGFDEPGVAALAGGEALPAPLARRLRARVRRLWNVYGPTESTIWSTAWEVPPEPAEVSIGAPLTNTSVYVLDATMEPVPTGVPGELYIGGTGLARGYLNRPAATAERFVPHPYGPPGARLYRTGDRVRREPGGLTFLGRTDNQVKLRGHRIELGEIEARLLELPGVREAAVVLWGEELVAYITGLATGLRESLAGVLPRSLVPARFVTLDRMPLTPNGKLDRSALPEPSRERPEPPRTAPADELTGKLAEIWREVLGIDRIGPDEDLFDLGGHSLTITQIIARIRRRLGIDLPLHIFYDTPTIAGVAAAIRSGGHA